MAAALSQDGRDCRHNDSCAGDAGDGAIADTTLWVAGVVERECLAQHALRWNAPERIRAPAVAERQASTASVIGIPSGARFVLVICIRP
jgi:hypothetical protein